MEKQKKIDTKAIEYHIAGILKALGDDPEREGLKDTPKRVAKMYEEVFEGMNYTNEEIYIKPERLWVTSVEEISIDAGDVIEDACDGLWEEASEQCDREGLQDLLDNWCKKQTGATTYYPCYKEYVIIDWNQY